MRRLVIDTDTASDDAVALVMALRAPDAQVEAVTVVSGNVPLDQAVQNALYTVELCGAGSVPVHAGAARPLLGAPRHAQHVHGQDGMGDVGLPLRGREPASHDAVGALVDVLGGGGVELLTLGPLTNVAQALVREPELARVVPRVVAMAGVGFGYGNVSPVAEFNVWADPDAAAVVFRSGLPLTMVGWDVSIARAVFAPAEADELRALGPLGEFAVSIQAVLAEFCRTETRLAGFDLPDPIAAAVALDPEVATRVERLFVDVELGGEWSRGQTIVDHLGVTGRTPNVDVVLDASRERFVERLRAALAR